MARSIPKGLSRESVFKAIANLDEGVEQPLVLPTGDELVHEG